METKKDAEKEEKESISSPSNQNEIEQMPNNSAVGFSLSKMLGLETITSGPKEEEAPQSKSIKASSSFERISSNKADLANISVSNFLFDPSILESTPPEEYAFWRHAGWEEIVSMWKYIRPEIRQSIRTCIKDSKQKHGK